MTAPVVARNLIHVSHDGSHTILAGHLGSVAILTLASDEMPSYCTEAAAKYAQIDMVCRGQ